MKKTMFAAVAAVLLVLTACKKDKDQTTLDRIMGKWGVKKSTDAGVHNGGPRVEYVYNGKAADYVDFKSNEIAEQFLDGEKDLIPYKVQGDTAILFFGEELYKIKTLTNTELVLYYKDIETNGYTEYTMELKR